MRPKRRRSPMASDWLVRLRPDFGTVAFFLLLATCDVVRSTGNGNNAGSAGSSGCQYLNPSQLERKLRDEGDFDHRYMAPDLEDAVNRFTDLADAKFIKKAEAYSCDAHCAIRTEQVRSKFAEYGQMPMPVGPGDSGLSFASIRQVLEGHLGVPAASGGQWNGPLFPDFSSNVPVQSQPQGNLPDDSRPPSPSQTSKQQFPPMPFDSAFPLAPPTLAPAGARTTSDDPDDITQKTPRPKLRRTKMPPSQGGGFKWLTPGDLVNDPPVDDLDFDIAATTRPPRRHNRRDRRAAPVNSTSIGQGLQIRCSKKGEEEQPGLHLLCGACRVIRELPADYFPRYINEVACSGQTCFDKASQGGGRCIEQFINFDILKNVGTSECQKWTTYTIAVPVCCSCLMSDALAQYLKMPWNGHSLTTSGPKGPG